MFQSGRYCFNCVPEYSVQYSLPLPTDWIHALPVYVTTKHTVYCKWICTITIVYLSSGYRVTYVQLPLYYDDLPVYFGWCVSVLSLDPDSCVLSTSLPRLCYFKVMVLPFVCTHMYIHNAMADYIIIWYCTKYLSQVHSQYLLHVLYIYGCISLYKGLYI